MNDTHEQHHRPGRAHGPSAARLADRLPQRVRFERGWYWTAAVCHGSTQDQLSFRQRPDGEALEVRCQSAACSRERIIRQLEALSGESIWSSDGSEPRQSVTNRPVKRVPGVRSWRALLTLIVVILLAAPLALGYDIQIIALNALGFSWAAWLVRQFLSARRQAVERSRRRR